MRTASFQQSNGYGKLVVIDHGNGWATYYAHLDKIRVQVGQRVSQGQALGSSGNTSAKYTIGAHLHYEVRHGSNYPANVQPAVFHGKRFPYPPAPSRRRTAPRSPPDEERHPCAEQGGDREIDSRGHGEADRQGHGEADSRRDFNGHRDPQHDPEGHGDDTDRGRHPRGHGHDAALEDRPALDDLEASERHARHPEGGHHRADDCPDHEARVDHRTLGEGPDRPDHLGEGPGRPDHRTGGPGRPGAGDRRRPRPLG